MNSITRLVALVAGFVLLLNLTPSWGQPVCASPGCNELRYAHPRHGAPVTIRQAVRVRREPDAFMLHVAQRAELVCWGVMPSGMLRHPLFVRWLG